MLAGIDEAGRGSLLGHMVIAGVLIDEKDEETLKFIGVRDSKKLTPTRRNILASAIAQIAKKITVVSISPKDIDSINLNEITARTSARIIDFFGPDRVVLDALSHGKGIAKYKDKVENFSRVSWQGIEIIAENKADENHVVVGAASIIAKVIRDNHIYRIQQKYPDYKVGSGYPSDNVTRSFVKQVYEATGFLPLSVRKKWSSVKKIINS